MGRAEALGLEKLHVDTGRGILGAYQLVPLLNQKDLFCNEKRCCEERF